MQNITAAESAAVRPSWLRSAYGSTVSTAPAIAGNSRTPVRPTPAAK